MNQTEIARLLPDIFQRTLRPGNPLHALLGVMETLHAPSETALAGLDAYFDPYRAPERFVPFLAGWVDLAWLLTDTATQADAEPLATGSGRLRELVASAARLARHRGTAQGLRDFLELATGQTGFVVDEQVPGEDGLPRPFHIRVLAPQATEPYRTLLQRIIEMEKPASVTYELVFGTGEA